MDENINESVETQEVAEPETEALESEETSEVAEPTESESSTEEAVQEEAEESESSGRTEADAAFAQMRRDYEAADKERKMLTEALSKYFEGDTAEELFINALAYAEERDPDEYREDYEKAQKYESLENENKSLKDQLLNEQVKAFMREGLSKVQAIDPEVKSLDDLGESFATFIGAGLSVEDAYFATKASELHNKILPPDAIGRVGETKVDRDYFTSEEIDALSIEDIQKNWDKVQRSLEKL